MTGMDERFKEIDLQTRMMNALPTWLTALKSLKEAATDTKLELRGNSEINAAAQILMGRGKQ